MGQDGDELVCFALAKTGGSTRETEKDLVEMRKRSGVWRRQGEKRWKGPSAADDVDGVICAEMESTLVVVVVVSVGEKSSTGAWARRG